MFLVLVTVSGACTHHTEFEMKWFTVVGTNTESYGNKINGYNVKNTSWAWIFFCCIWITHNSQQYKFKKKYHITLSGILEIACFLLS